MEPNATARATAGDADTATSSTTATTTVTTVEKLISPPTQFQLLRRGLHLRLRSVVMGFLRLTNASNHGIFLVRGVIAVSIALALALSFPGLGTYGVPLGIMCGAICGITPHRFLFAFLGCLTLLIWLVFPYLEGIERVSLGRATTVAILFYIGHSIASATQNVTAGTRLDFEILLTWLRHTLTTVAITIAMSALVSLLSGTFTVFDPALALASGITAVVTVIYLLVYFLHKKPST